MEGKQKKNTFRFENTSLRFTIVEHIVLRIILNPSFYDYTIKSFLGLALAILNGNDHFYIAAIDSMNFYEVTTQEDMEKYGIEIVNQIGQE